MQTKQPTKPVDYLTDLDPTIPVDLVLSGGGEKGVGHIALLNQIEELGLTINSISGCSIGAMVGAFYGSGMSPKEILTFFKETSLFRFSWLNPIKPGIFNSEKYKHILKEHIKEDFESLRIPLHLNATNIQQGKTVYFNQGELLYPLLASCAVPLYFNPVKIEDELYSDGGVMDNFPIKPVQQSSYPIIGSYVCKPNQKNKKQLNSIIKISNHANSLLMYAANRYKFEKTYHTYIFPLGHFPALNSKSIGEMYDISTSYLHGEAVELEMKDS